jgi:hypothetical protein
MKFVTAVVAMIFALTATGSIYAQGRGQGQAKKTTVSAPKTAKIKTETPKQTKTQTTKTETRTAKTEARATKTAAKAETRAAKTAAKAETRAVKAETKAARKSGTTTTATTTPVVDVTPTTPTTQHVKNPKLEARLLALLPPGSTIQDASAGFKNWGQFVAAAHVSTNLGIPFADLKTAMTGIAPGATTPTTAPMSLGQAIQSLKGTTPETETLSSTKIRTEVKKAEDAANDDLRRSRERI